MKNTEELETDKHNLYLGTMVRLWKLFEAHVYRKWNKINGIAGCCQR
jgi:hypothetical protein